MTEPQPTADLARRLVLDLCERAGSSADVSDLLMATPRAHAPQQAAALALTALHIIFTECLSEPVPTNARPDEGNPR